jgi:DNA-binding NtrC family response regulator
MMAKPVALIVEDEALLMIHAIDVVEDAGFKVLEARNADEAVAILESRDDIRVVLTDVNMPGSMNGMKLAWAVRDRWPPVVVIVMSGHVKPAAGDLPDDVAFIGKPYNDRQIRAALAVVS